MMKVNPQKASKEIIMMLPTLWSEAVNLFMLSAILTDPIKTTLC